MSLYTIKPKEVEGPQRANISISHFVASQLALEMIRWLSSIIVQIVAEHLRRYGQKTLVIWFSDQFLNTASVRFAVDTS